MTFIKTGIIALALTASLGALASSASAQTRAERIAAAREARAQAQDYRVQQQQRYRAEPGRRLLLQRYAVAEPMPDR